MWDTTSIKIIYKLPKNYVVPAKPKGLLSYFWIQVDLINFDFIPIFVLIILFWTILGIKHENSLGLPKKLFDDFENMYVSELDSKSNFTDYQGLIIHKKNVYADK